jgi:hypothetical protein
MRILSGVGCVGLILCLVSERALPQNKNIDLQIVKYDALKQAVLKSRGRVLVVDFWGEF